MATIAVVANLSKGKSIALWILRDLAAVAFWGAGEANLAGAAPMIVMFARLGLGHRDLGDLPSPPQRQVEILAAPFRVAAHRDLGRFHQQETQQRTPLLGDMSQPPSISARLF